MRLYSSSALCCLCIKIPAKLLGIRICSGHLILLVESFHIPSLFFLFLVFIALSSPWTFFLPLLLIVLQFSGHFISPPHHGRQTVFYSSGLSLVVLSCVHDSLLHRFFLRPFFCLREDCHFLVSRGWSLLFLTLLFLPWWSCYPSLLGYTVDLQLASIFRNG